jgi:hypothetical protein
MEKEFTDQLTKLTADIERLTPNMHALERYGLCATTVEIRRKFPLLLAGCRGWKSVCGCLSASLRRPNARHAPPRNSSTLCVRSGISPSSRLAMATHDTAYGVQIRAVPHGVHPHRKED